ncbi:MAG TPA: POTRA domain-containing protein [Candidatus Limnocylindrales bacterium]|nr:POTRA domain-containing protein [Candidatus Limnocylindrales bacterium]
MFSQEPGTAPTLSYEGQKVSSVEVAGRPDLNRHSVEALIKQPLNAPYREAEVNATIAALKQLNGVTKVTTQVEPEANGLRVLFVLEPGYYFGVFQFPKGTSNFTYTRLLQAANYPRQEPYTRARVDEATSNLLSFYHQAGYFRAAVEPELDIDQQHGIVNVNFLSTLRKRAKFGEVSIEGLQPDEEKQLESSLRSLRARIRAAYIKPGKPYTLKRLQNAIKFLQTRLGSQHYLAARVRLVSTVYHDDTNRADIHIHIEKRSQIRIQVAGAHVWGRTQKKLIPIYQENSVDPDLVLEGQQNLQSYFEAKGFFDAKVQSHVEKQPTGYTIRYDIAKGKRGKVTGLEFKGNQHFSDGKLKDHVAIEKARRYIPFSHGKYSEKLVRTSVKNLEGLYQAAGYSKVSVTPQVSNQNGKLSVAFLVNEGERDIVESLKVEGNNSIPEYKLVPKGLNLQPGKPYSQQLMDQDRDLIMANYLDHGFLTMVFRAQVNAPKNDPHHIQVVYMIDEGPQVYTAKVDPVGAPNSNKDVILKSANIKVGKPLSQSALLRGEGQMYSMGGAFDWANVDSRRPITEQKEAEVLIRLHEAKRNTITYGFGFEVTKRGGSVPGGTVAVPGLPPVGLPTDFKASEQTFWGPRGSIEYTRRNFRGRAETLSAGVFGARLEQRATVGWANPTFWNSVWSSTLSASIDRSSQNPIFTSRIGQAGLQFERYLDAKKTKSVYLRYNFSRTSLTNVLIPGLVLPEDQNVRLSTLSASFIRDTRDDVLDAHRGLYESFQGDLNPSFLGSNTNFTRFLGQTAYYKPVFSKSVVWANSIRVGVEESFAGAHIPISESFFSGGGSTLRGFPLNGAGPQRPVQVCGAGQTAPNCPNITVPVGGPQLLILNSELRFPSSLLNKLGGVVFYDGGNVYSHLGKPWDGYSNTVGIGARYATPVGPVRFDIGRNLNPVTGVSAWQYFITLGQAF